MKLDQLLGGFNTEKINGVLGNNKLLIIAAAAVLSILAFSKGNKFGSPGGFFSGFGQYGKYSGTGGFNAPPPGYILGHQRTKKKKHRHRRRYDEYAPEAGYYPYNAQRNPVFGAPGFGNPTGQGREFHNSRQQEYGSQGFGNNGFENPMFGSAYQEGQESTDE